MNWTKLTKQDTQLYKGVAIFMIVYHNFMHSFPSPKENEFTFSRDRFIELFHMF